MLSLTELSWYDKNGKLQNILDFVHPVGSIYMTMDSQNPSTLFGGEWVSWGSGRVPVGVNTLDTDFATVEQTGGEKTHTLTVDELAAHEHSGTSSSKFEEGYTIGTGGSFQGHSGTITHTVQIKTVDNTSAKTYYPNGKKPDGVTTTVTQDYAVKAGGGASHNNLQPYITCYMWKRMA